MKTIDWKTIEQEYVQGDESQHEIAKRFGVSRQRLSVIAAENNWSEKRTAFKHKAVHKAVKKAKEKAVKQAEKQLRAEGVEEDEAAERAANPLARAIAGADKLIAVVTDRLAKADEMNTRELADISRIYKDITPLLRDYYDMPTPQQKEQMRIAAEKLELDKKKLEAEQQQDTTVHIIMGGADEYAQ